MGKKPAKIAGRPGAQAEIVRGAKVVQISRAQDRFGGFVAWYNSRRVGSGVTKEACQECAVRNGYALPQN